MKIVDTNILNKVLKDEIAMSFSGDVYTTEDLRREIDMLSSIFPNFKSKVRDINFVNIEGHRHFNEANYLRNYRILINKYPFITSFYGLKGLGDMSILAGVATVINHAPTLFDTTNEAIEVFTHDDDLKTALGQEFPNQITINDPLMP